MINNNSNFIKDLIHAVAKPEDIDDYIEYWHNHETGNDLHEFLGMTLKEYAEFCRDTYILGKIVDYHRADCNCMVAFVHFGTVNPFKSTLCTYVNGRWVQIKEYSFDARKEGYQKTDEEHYNSLVDFISFYDVDIVFVNAAAVSFVETIRRHGEFKVAAFNEDFESFAKIAKDDFVIKTLRHKDGRIKDFFVKDVRCSTCGANVYHYELHKGNKIFGICNNCGNKICEVKSEYINEHLLTGLWLPKD